MERLRREVMTLQFKVVCAIAAFYAAVIIISLLKGGD